VLQIATSKVTGDAFEDVLYGSQSELDDSDDEESIIVAGNKKKNDQDVRLRLDDDEPMDLLEGAAMRITGFFLRH
jgi:ribosomal RNA-processing protein 12